MAQCTYVYECVHTLYSTPFYKILVPTVDTLRYNFLVHNLIKEGRPVLLVGPVGTGKTSIAQGVLQKLDPGEYNLLTINLSAQVRRNCDQRQAALISMLFPSHRLHLTMFKRSLKEKLKRELKVRTQVYIYPISSGS